MHNFPLLTFFWMMLEFFLWVLWIFLFFRIITDVFRSSDLSGPGKAGWTLVLLIFPFVGAFAYIIVRGSDMHLRENRQAVQNAEMFGRLAAQYSQNSGADDVAKLASLRERGLLTDGEFTDLKTRAMAATTAG